jgi:hypothetical protein
MVLGQGYSFQEMVEQYNAFHTMEIYLRKLLQVLILLGVLIHREVVLKYEGSMQYQKGR